MFKRNGVKMRQRVKHELNRVRIKRRINYFVRTEYCSLIIIWKWEFGV